MGVLLRQVLLKGVLIRQVLLKGVLLRQVLLKGVLLRQVLLFTFFTEGHYFSDDGTPNI
jgi:hypothetical protein